MAESQEPTQVRMKPKGRWKRRVRALIVVPAAVVLMLAGTVAVASAATGSPSGAPPAANNIDVWCVSTTGARACFAAGGDIVWVKDTKANGASAAGTISGHNFYRACYNHVGAAKGWVKCDFDVPEYQSGDLWAVNNPFVGNMAYTGIYTSNTI